MGVIPVLSIKEALEEARNENQFEILNFFDIQLNANPSLKSYSYNSCSSYFLDLFPFALGTILFHCIQKRIVCNEEICPNLIRNHGS